MKLSNLVLNSDFATYSVLSGFGYLITFFCRALPWNDTLIFCIDILIDFRHCANSHYKSLAIVSRVSSCQMEDIWCYYLLNHHQIRVHHCYEWIYCVNSGSLLQKHDYRSVWLWSVWKSRNIYFLPQLCSY